MANIYWVGGAGTWNTSSTANWANASGGTGGTGTVPTAADSVFFDSGSGTPGTVTMTGALLCLDITVSVTGWTFADGTSPTLAISGNIALNAGTTWSSTGAITFKATAAKTINTNAVSIAAPVTLNGVGGYWTLLSGFTINNNLFQITNGTFDTNPSGNYSVSVGGLQSTNSNTRAIILNGSTVTISGNGAGALDFTNTTNLSFNAGTSNILLGKTTGFTSQFGNLSYYNVTLNAGFGSFSSGNNYRINSNGASFNNFVIGGSAGAYAPPCIAMSGTYTISTFSVTNPNINSTTLRFQLRYGSDPQPPGTFTLFNVTNVSGTFSDIDFMDIHFTGTAAPISGTRLGDGGGNSGITFAAAKTVYYVGTTGTANYTNASNAAWSTTPGISFTASRLGTALTTTGNPSLAVGMTVYTAAGANLGTIVSGSGNSWVTSGSGTVASTTMVSGNISTANFPLAQDTAIIDDRSLNSGQRFSLDWDGVYGTISFANRTLAITFGIDGYADILGNVILSPSLTFVSGNATSVTLCTTGTQTITSAGSSWPLQIRIFAPGGTVRLTDSLNMSVASGIALYIWFGTFDANGNNVSALNVSSNGALGVSTYTRTIAIGSGTWTVTGSSSSWDNGSTNLTITGTGTITMTSATAKTFAGASVSYGSVVLDQGGAGALTISGSNTFGNITNTYSATGATTITFTSGTTTTVAAFAAVGTAGKLLTLNSSSSGSAFNMVLTGGGKVSVSYLSVKDSHVTPSATTWYAGANSTNVSGNTGWIFTNIPPPTVTIGGGITIGTGINFN